MSWAQRCFGLARAHLHKCFECTYGCHSVQSALHLAVSCVINLHAHFYFRERQVLSHYSWPAFTSMSAHWPQAVLFAVPQPQAKHPSSPSPVLVPRFVPHAFDPRKPGR